jgi:two-component system response regulator AlgR
MGAPLLHEDQVAPLEAKRPNERPGKPAWRVCECRPGLLRVVARRRTGLVFLDLDEVWGFEAAGRLTFVHSSQGRFDVDLTLATLEASLGHCFARVHRNWLIHLRFVKALESAVGDTTLVVGPSVAVEALRVPVSRARASAVRELLLEHAAGVRLSTGP